MIRKLLILVFFLALNFSLFSQKIKKVKKSDFGFQNHTLDTLAGASYIFSTLKMESLPDEQIQVLLMFHERLRIHHEDGIDYANYEIDLFNDGEFSEKLSSLKAITYNLEDGKLKKSKFDKSTITEKDITERHVVKSFTLPNVKPGSIIDVYYEIETPFIFDLPHFYFQHYIPVDFASFQSSFPFFIKTTPLVTGNITLEHSEREQAHYDEPAITTKFSASNIKPIYRDKYVLNENDYRSGLKYNLELLDWNSSEVNKKKLTWDSIGYIIYNNYGCKSILESKIESADSFLNTIKSETPLNRCKLIYDYVRMNFQCDGSLNNYIENKLLKINNQNIGSAAEINLLLTNLLIKSGIEAYPYVVKSRSKGILKRANPSLSNLDYLMTLAYLDNEPIALDASSKEYPFNILPLEAISYIGLIIKDNKSELINLDNSNKYLSLRQAAYNLNLIDKHLEGEGEKSLNTFASVKHRLKVKGLDIDEQRVEENTSQFNSFNSKDVMFFRQMSNLESLYQKIQFNFTEKKYDVFKVSNDQILLNSDLNLGLAENPFTKKLRENPVFYNNRIELRNLSFVNIPSGYVVDYLPEKIIVSLPDNKGQYFYETKVILSEEGAQQIQISTNFKINETIFLSNEYPALFEFYRLIFQKQSEKIILKKEED